MTKRRLGQVATATAIPQPMIVIGSGWLADACRRQIAADPDRYRARSSSIKPIGKCPCCEQKVYRVTSKPTNWQPGYATGTEDDAALHQGFDDAGALQPTCCRKR